ncbi:MAG: hypothetical protein ACFFBD_22060, partial [Candidatus Hodarchaeota archaeon]
MVYSLKVVLNFRKIFAKRFLPLWLIVILAFGVNLIWTSLTIFSFYIANLIGASQTQINQYRLIPLLILMYNGNPITDWLIMDVFLIIICTIIFYLLSPFVAQVLILRFLKLQKIALKERKMYILPNPDEERGIGLLLSRSLLLIMVGLGVSTYAARIVPQVMRWLSTPQAPIDSAFPEILDVMNQGIAFLYFLIPLLAMLLPAAWILDDIGLVSAEAPKVGSLEVRRQGKDFLAILKFFAGISVILIYLELAINAFPAIGYFANA